MNSKNLVIVLLFVFLFYAISFPYGIYRLLENEAIGASFLTLLGTAIGFLGGIWIAQLRSKSEQQIANAQLKNRWRMVAMDKRLRVHQEAFHHWRRLYHEMHDPIKMRENVNTANDWWENNNLYLSGDLSERFVLVISQVATYQQFVDMGRGSGDLSAAEMIKNDRESIRRLGDEIRQAVGKADLGELGYKDLEPKADEETTPGQDETI